MVKNVKYFTKAACTDWMFKKANLRLSDWRKGTFLEPRALDAELCFPVWPGELARRSAVKLISEIWGVCIYDG